MNDKLLVLGLLAATWPAFAPICKRPKP
jgi:hypothetical protein